MELAGVTLTLLVKLKPSIIRKVGTFDAHRLIPSDFLTVPGNLHALRLELPVKDDPKTPNYLNFSRADPAYKEPGARLGGFFYYNIPYPRQFLSGGLRFKCCASRSNGFAFGYDLPGNDRLPWTIALPALLRKPRHATFIRQLVHDGLLTPAQIEIAKEINVVDTPNSRKVLSGGNPPPFLCDVDQPFVWDLSARAQRVVIPGPRAMLRFRLIYPRVARHGSAIVRFERTPHEGELYVRILHPRGPCEYLPEYRHLAPLVAGEFLPHPTERRPWTWTYDDGHDAQSAGLHCLLHPIYHEQI
ncbi:hypothetical protein FB451DRAFT_1378814 [Mycena latifolia]|nr:hypothetical protein FB451DRAFT_1378814 [Mycena latifolia]